MASAEGRLVLFHGSDWQRPEDAAPVKFKLAIATLMVALTVGAAYGKECTGIQFLDELQVQRTPLQLNGLGLRKATVFNVNIYIVALYVRQGKLHDE
jgi:hypothetical protein